MGSEQWVARVRVRNIGGIAETTVGLGPGVTVLAGRNATNRTSFLKALAAALGADVTALKRDADRGSVELAVGGETYSRHLERTDDGVVADGDPYLDDAELAELFAVLLESNDIRRAVRSGGDLGTVLMRPVDTASIEADIASLESEKRSVDDRLDDLASLADERSSLEAERDRLESEIDSLETELTALEDEIATADASLDEGIEREAELDERLTELREARQELESITDRLEDERESLAAVREERARVSSELSELPDEADDRLAAIDEELDELRERKRRIDADVNDLQGIIRFNEDQLSDANSTLLNRIDAVGSDGDSVGGGTAAGEGAAGASNGVAPGGEGAEPGARPGEHVGGGDGPAANADGAAGRDHVTDRLTGTEPVICWTCGSRVDRAAIDATLDNLRSLRERTLERRREVNDRLDELKERREELESRRRRRSDLAAELERTAEELERREERVSDLERRRRELNESVRDLETAVEQLRTDEYEDLLDLHRRANERQVELERYRSDLATVESELATVDERLEERDSLEDRRERLQSELVELRTRIDRIAEETVSTFNEHAATVLDVLGYDNIARVWLERTTPDADRSTAAGQRFTLHVVREGEDGVFEDSVEHLSESEREVAGLVLALAGYLAYDVDELVPFVLLDSLEAIDADRIAALVDYFADHADYLVAALLEGDAAAIDRAHERVTDI